MVLPRMRSPRGSTRRRMALWSALAMGSILPSVGCQVEYAGMTLPRAGTCTMTSSISHPALTSPGPTPRRRLSGPGCERWVSSHLPLAWCPSAAAHLTRPRVSGKRAVA